MTTIYTLQDGGIITATCASDFVTKLRESSRFDSACTDHEYLYLIHISLTFTSQ